MWVTRTIDNICPRKGLAKAGADNTNNLTNDEARQTAQEAMQAMLEMGEPAIHQPIATQELTGNWITAISIGQKYTAKAQASEYAACSSSPYRQHHSQLQHRIRRATAHRPQ
jgi:hypothetical protein